jgi:hypothetical protein
MAQEPPTGDPRGPMCRPVWVQVCHISEPREAVAEGREEGGEEEHRGAIVGE